jgi:hypothetical protein
LGMKLLTVALMGILALPTGFCREQSDASEAVPASQCCERSVHHLPIPGFAKSSLSCCCQARLTAVQDTKPRKRPVSELSLLVPLAERHTSARLGRATCLSTPALFPHRKHPLQASLCVWRL